MEIVLILGVVAVIILVVGVLIYNGLVQRRLRIGYTRAARLIDMMEDQGVVGPPTEGSKPREVLPAGD